MYLPPFKTLVGSKTFPSSVPQERHAEMAFFQMARHRILDNTYWRIVTYHRSDVFGRSPPLRNSLRGLPHIELTGFLTLRLDSHCNLFGTLDILWRNVKNKAQNKDPCFLGEWHQLRRAFTATGSFKLVNRLRLVLYKVPT